MNRRGFLWGLAGLGLNAMMPRAAWAVTAADSPALVVVHLRGGNDGLNTVVPHGEDAYYALRPTIAIPRPGSAPAAALNLDGFFGLHPALEPLYALYQEGYVALLPTVHCPLPSRSHYESRGIIDGAGGASGTGWLNRYLAVDSPGPGAALAIGVKPPPSLRGPVSVPAHPSPASLRLLGSQQEEPLLRTILETAYADPAAAGHPGGARWRPQAAALFGDLERASLARVVTSGAGYPDEPFGRQLAEVAAILRTDTRLRVATVTLDGWDTHNRQGGSEGAHAARLVLLGKCLAAFRQDLGARWQDTCMLVTTEFGRTAAENASGGTDHGHAGAWMVLGGRVQGGIYTGLEGWPGLDAFLLDEGRYLRHTVDYRDVYAEVLRGHLQATDVTTVLPGHSPSALSLFTS